MSDLSDRLRCNPVDCDGDCWNCRAADELDRLTAENERLQHARQHYARGDGERIALATANSELRSEVLVLRRQVEAVKALHQAVQPDPDNFPKYITCGHCNNEFGVGRWWPCPTVRALEGEQP